MKTPLKPLDLMVKSTRERLTKDEQLQLTAYIGKLYDVAHYNEGLAYQLEYNKRQLEAENRFLIKLINVKLEG